MKITLGIIAIQLAAFSFAQNESLDIAPNTSSNSPAGTKALWDIQLSVNATSETDNSVGMAAIAFHNNEFWVSKWASDSIFRLSNTGTLISKFIISGVSGTRAITSDGTNLYFSNASNTISIIDPITQTVSGTITSAASQTSRFLTYDPTLDGGNGGFWTGNFSTDIFAISMSGAVLSSIPAATHTLGGMYGAAIDNETAGGPYLWVYHQAGTNNCQLTALDMNTGLPSAMVRDVYPDISVTHSLSSGLAGGAFFSSSFVPGTNSVMVLTQGTPSNIITVYEVESSAFLSENDAVQLNLFPNPSSDMITLSSDGSLVPGTSMELLDMNGSILRVIKIEEGVNEFELDVQNLQKGTYFIRLHTEGNVQLLRFVK